MAGQRQKPADQLINKRGGRAKALKVVPRDSAFVAPKAPAGLREYGKRVWDAFWASDVSGAVDVNAHGEDLAHWIRCVDEREHLWKILRQAPLVKGSHGQLMQNPLIRSIRELTHDIEWASDRFGMTPLAQFRMQFTVSEAGKSAAELLKMLMDDAPDDSDIIDVDAL